PHITMELLLRQAGVQVTHLAYKGAAPALTDLLAGVAQLKYDTYATTSPLLPSGKVKVLATAGRARLPQLPNVATVAQGRRPLPGGWHRDAGRRARGARPADSSRASAMGARGA